ncbi:DUF1592 domain-containing protein [Calycomorphotria hydatis]|uniref:Planctomycete cytochrome C n=1 Tax=Calycomorphotria hydatis TaxID=2528027 RepID=A0A517T630_9PLAN|nr:DUF1592 domain-containing protein [Calycomorphotria hydatis]QDT63842.1 hypothetical protein V22_10670 [Calycomorphotria hydatis]
MFPIYKILLVAACLLVAGVSYADNVVANDLQTLITSNCLDCHDNLGRAGDLSLEELGGEIDAGNASSWANVLEYVERGFMPPLDAEQPPHELREAAIIELEKKLVSYYAGQPTDLSTVLRRLNRTEYRNTIEDLLKLKLGSDPTTDFPGEKLAHGFATNGETLVTSSFLFRQYLNAADDIINRAVHFEEKPEVRSWDMDAPFDRTTGQEVSQAIGYFKKQNSPQPYQDICQRIGAGGAPYRNYHPLDDLSGGVPISGWYRVRIEAEGKFRHSLRQDLFKRFPSKWNEEEPIRLSLFTGDLYGIDLDNKEGVKFTKTHEQASQKHFATWDLPDDERVQLECKVWLEKGQFLRLGFPNGPTNSNYRMNTYFNDFAEETLSSEEFAEFEGQKKKYGGWFGFVRFESPRVRLHDIQVEGPINDVWPPESHRVIFGESAYQSELAEEVLRQFAERAWRRPVHAYEVAAILELVRTSEANGLTAKEAICEGLKAVLCSPDFLYLEERGNELTGHEVASRLSYFFWSTMPDEQLLARADSGELLTSAGRRAEADRLLNDPRSTQFVDEFLDGWLQLNKLGSMAPDPHRFRVYYDNHLEEAMRTETRLFFHHLLATNGSISNFLDSDYTFTNENLAEFYGFDFPEITSSSGSELDTRLLRQDGLGDSPTTMFRKVNITDRRRGGLLGQAAVLTLTANGVDTSPVIRGVWLLENILGTPPPPPPANVPAIEPDIRGAKTIREQLQKHRESEACSSCHSYIDPPGFALETFDAIGNWRGHYKMANSSPEIDSAGEFGLKPFADVVGFKELLVQRQDSFARCMVEKLLIFALGRELEITDRPHIRKILDDNASSNYRLRDLVLSVAECELMQQK